MHYPAMVEANTVCHSPIQFIDVMPTFAELAGAAFPSEFNGNAIQPVEGESFLPALTGADWQRQKPLYWEPRGQSRRPHRRLEIGQQTPGPIGSSTI